MAMAAMTLLIKGMGMGMEMEMGMGMGMGMKIRIEMELIGQRSVWFRFDESEKQYRYLDTEEAVEGIYISDIVAMCWFY